MIWQAERTELEKIYKSLEDSFPEIKREIQQLIRTDDPNVAMLYSRRCLEVIVTKLCESELKRPRRTEPLKGIIDKLNSEDIVPSNIITSMHGINSLSAYGAHPKDFDPEQVKPVLSNLKVVIDWFIRFAGSGQLKAGSDSEILSKGDSTEGQRGINRLKRVLLPISVVGLLAILAVVYVFLQRGGSDQDIEKSIAVLPFRNDSNDDSTQYFINGVTEETLLNLQVIKELRVISRTSVEQYRNPTKSIPEIASELGVNYIVEGSAQKYGNHIRLRVVLFMAEKERQIWSNVYQEEINEVQDIVRIHCKIAEAIAGELNAAITPEERELIEKVPTENMEAYDSYVLGRYYWRKFTPADLEKALEHFKHAIDKDNNFTLAYVGISDVYFGFIQLGFSPPGELDPVGKYLEALTKARFLDSTLAEVHYSLANMYANVKWDWPASEREFIKALEIKPGLSDVYAALSNLYAILERTEESVETGKLALKQDPKNVFNKVHFAATLMFAREYAAAINICEEVLEDDPDNFLCRNILPYVFHSSGKYEESLNAWKVFVSAFYNSVDINLDIIFGFNNTIDNYRDILNRLADDILDHIDSVKFDIFNLAAIYACAGNREKSMEMLIKCYKDQNPNTPYIVNPVFDLLKNDPTYIDLRKKMNLPVYLNE